MFQRRYDGSINFHRGWSSYKNGFGDISQEFWIGNDYIHTLSKNWLGSELRIELIDYDDEIRIAEYGRFAIGNESTLYSLTVGMYRPSHNDAGM